MSANHRWMKWWPQDWQRDPALRSCGVAARGLWMDFICMMHEGTPYGHLTINGKPPSLQQLATLSSVSLKEITGIIAELENAGVFSRTSDGTIFCRRMIRDNEASEAGRVYVARRLNGRDHATDKPPPNGAPPSGGDHGTPSKGSSRTPSRTPSRGASTLEDRSKEKERALLRNDAEASRHARSDIWTIGVARVISITGFSERSARGLVGRWCRDAADDYALVGEVLVECAEIPRADNVAWITAAIKERVKPEAPFDWDAACGITRAPEPPSGAHELEGYLDGDSYRVH